MWLPYWSYLYSLIALVVHLEELELRHLEAGHGPPAGKRLDIVAQRLHVGVVLSKK